jgi:hypothetical protein
MSIFLSARKSGDDKDAAKAVFSATLEERKYREGKYKLEE